VDDDEVGVDPQPSHIPEPLRPRSVPVYLEVFGPVLGCFSRARLKHSKTLVGRSVDRIWLG
jgi:hypothetical protein